MISESQTLRICERCRQPSKLLWVCAWCETILCRECVRFEEQVADICCDCDPANKREHEHVRSEK